MDVHPRRRGSQGHLPSLPEGPEASGGPESFGSSAVTPRSLDDLPSSPFDSPAKPPPRSPESAGPSLGATPDQANDRPRLHLTVSTLRALGLEGELGWQSAAGQQLQHELRASRT